MSPGWVQTVSEAVAVEALSLILPHEHLFTICGGRLSATIPHRSGARGAGDGVLLGSSPRVGVTAVVECSTVGIGGNLTVLRY